MINMREGEVRPATAAGASSPHNSNKSNSSNTRNPNNTHKSTNKLTATSTTHDDQPIATGTGKRVNNPESSNELATPFAAAAALSPSSSSSPPLAPQLSNQCTMPFAPAAPVPISVAGVMNPEATELLRSNGSVVPASMSGTWQQSAVAATAMYHHQQQQQSALKIRPFPVPPSIIIPPPEQNPQVLFSDVDVSMTPREFGKMSPVLGPSTTSVDFPAFSGDGMLAMSPLSCQFAPGSGSHGGMATLPSPLKVNVVLRPKPTTDGVIPPTTSDAAPVSPTVMKDMQLATPRFLPDMWTFESPPANVYAMLVRQPQSLDLGYQQMTAAMMAPQHMNPQIQFQPDAHQQLQLQQQLGGFGIQTLPLAARMHQLYPHMSPVVVTSPHHHQLQLTMPPQQHAAPPSGAFSPTANFSMINFSEIMMLGSVGGSSGGDPGLLLPQSSPTNNILKQLLPPVIPHQYGVNVKDITLNELRPHFNKPMAVVAKELGVCITLMKKICRRNGLARWPHRRIRSLVNRITSLQVITANASDADQKRFQSQIATLREELSAVIQNPNEKSRKAQADAKARSPSSQMLVKEEDADEDNEGEDDDEEEVRESVKNGESMFTSNSKTVGRTLDETVSERDGSLFSKNSESSVHQGSSEDVDMHGHEESETSGVAKPGDSKKRKDFVQNSGNALLYPPPPIKIPCYRDGRPRRNSAPEQQHLRTLGKDGRLRDEAPDVDSERPSSTTSSSSRRGSILSILCDAAE